MGFLEKKICKRVTLSLFFLLSMQLTGLTCIQDLWAYVPVNNGPAVMITPTGDFDPSSKTSSTTTQQVVDHACPCHYLVTHLSRVTLGLTPYAGELATRLDSSFKDNLSQSIFRPPIVLF